MYFRHLCVVPSTKLNRWFSEENESKKKENGFCRKARLSASVTLCLVFLVYSVGSVGSELETMANSRLRVCQAYKMESVAFGARAANKPSSKFSHLRHYAKLVPKHNNK